MHICKVDRSGIVARHLHIIWKLMPRDARATIGSEKNFIYWKHIADERTSKAEETQKEVVRIVSHYLLSHNIGTHIDDIAAARLSTLLSSTQRKPNYMALPNDNMIDGRWDSTLRETYILKNTTHGSLQGPSDLLRNSRVSWTATKTTSV